MEIFLFALLRALLLSVLSFALAMAWTPLLAFVLYRFQLGKRIRTSTEAPVFAALHSKKAGTPTMGGLLIWVTAIAVAVIFWAFAVLWPKSFSGLNFLTRAETWLPLFALVAAGIVGCADDLMNVWGLGGAGGGLRVRHRLLLYAVIAAIGAWWFYAKLGWDTLHIPLAGDVVMGWWYLPFFLLVIVATSHSLNITDGLDGLAGGVALIVLGVYAAIALTIGKYDLAALTMVTMGSLLAFLWFNIYPARFIMGDTGAMSLGVFIGILAMLTNTALILPLIAFILVLESLSVIVQVGTKRILGRKLFISTPFHHHLEAAGWPEPKVVMRLWVVSGVMAALGFALFLVDRAFR